MRTYLITYRNGSGISQIKIEAIGFADAIYDFLRMYGTVITFNIRSI